MISILQIIIMLLYKKNQYFLDYNIHNINLIVILNTCVTKKE